MAKTAVALNQFVKENLRGYFENEKGLFGFVDSERDLESLLLALRSKHFEFSVRHSEERTGPKSFFFNFGDIPEQTTPFVINTATYKVCSYGNEYYKETQEKIKAKKQSEALALGVGQSKVKKRKPRKRKKTDCPGRMVIKELTFFPEYSIELKEESGKRSRCRTDMRKQLKKDIELGKAIWKATRYFVHVSHFHLHTGHPEMAAAELGFSVDVNKLNTSQKKIKTGITSWKDSSKSFRFPTTSGNIVGTSANIATSTKLQSTTTGSVSTNTIPTSQSTEQNVLKAIATSEPSAASMSERPTDDANFSTVTSEAVTGCISSSSSNPQSDSAITIPTTTVPSASEKRTVDDLRKDCRTLAHAISRASFRVSNEECLIQAVGLMQHSFEILQFGCASLKGLAMKNSPARKRPPLVKKTPVLLKRTLAIQNIPNLKKTKKSYASNMPVVSEVDTVSNQAPISGSNSQHELMHGREELNFASEQNRAILNLPTVLTIDGSQLGLQTGQTTSDVVIDQGQRQIRDHNINDNNILTISNITALLQQAGVSLHQTLIVPTDMSNQNDFTRVRDELGLGTEQTRALLNLPSVLSYDGTQLNIQNNQQLCNMTNDAINNQQIVNANKQADQDVLGLTTSNSMSQSGNSESLTTTADGQDELAIAAEQTVSSIPQALILEHDDLQENHADVGTHNNNVNHLEQTIDG